MQIYLFLLLTGAAGFVVMTLMGAMHGVGHHSGHGGLAGHGHTPLHSGHGGHSLPVGQPGPAAPAHGHSSSSSVAKFKSFRPWFALSPLDLFSFAIGAGAGGMLATIFGHPQSAVGAAIVGAIAFNFGVIKPLIGLIMKFVSNPSEGLEGAVALSARAITRFDSKGQGLVNLTLDGQIVQLLATLQPDERQSGVLVAKGDEVVIVEVDSKRNACVVTRQLSLE